MSLLRRRRVVTPCPADPIATMPESFRGTHSHVVLVAFRVDASGVFTAKQVQEHLFEILPHPIDISVDTLVLADWWVAEDERYDGSENASAVFVPKGRQRRARELLRRI